MGISTGRRRVGRAIAMGVFYALVCKGTQSAAPVLHTLHIESQPLDAALQELARQTGVQILFFSKLTERRRSTALHGRFTVDRAMTALLSGSALTYRVINAKTIEIVPVREP